MRLKLAPQFSDSTEALDAQRIIGQCVHCGFCTAVCPTYRLSGEELEGPRGRIYLMSSVLAGEPVSAVTRDHLDSCLGCRACESSCPSGVEYGRLLEIGQQAVEMRVPSPPWKRPLLKIALRTLMRPRSFAVTLWLGRVLRPLLPNFLKRHVPAKANGHSAPASIAASGSVPRRMILLEGCVQPALMPNVNAATRRVLARFGIEAITVSSAGCCGALPLHGGEHELALDAIRRNVDAWWGLVEQGAEALVMTASGCGVTVRDYGRLLAHDPGYAERAARISALTRDVVEIVTAEMQRDPSFASAVATAREAPRVAFHPPCTLLHGQRLGGAVESVLTHFGATVQPLAETGQCCGSAGTYSLRHPDVADALRKQRLEALEQGDPEEILSANVGCIAHLAAGTGVPVRHWIEWLDRRLAKSSS